MYKVQYHIFGAAATATTAMFMFVFDRIIFSACLLFYYIFIRSFRFSTAVHFFILRINF